VAPAQPAPVGSARILIGYTAAGFTAGKSLEPRLGLEQVASIPQLDVDVVRVAAGRVDGALRALRADPIVRYAQRDSVVQALRVPNDELWPSQWSPVKTNAVRAWDLTTGSSQVVVAVADTGVDPAQPDLRGKLVPGYDYVNGDSDPSDDNGHGTAVAGIIGADTNNELGVAGYCWHCLVMPVKVLGADGSGFMSTVAQGMVWATDHGARVINLSLGGPTDDLTAGAAAQYALAHGVLVVAAAGNDGSTVIDYPAALPNVLSVSASDESDRLYGFSNSGSALAAPGENATTAQGDGYELFLGTSSAAPVVSGIAALLFSEAPGATPNDVIQALETTAVPIPGVIYGRVNAYGAVRQLLPPAQSPQQTGTSSGPARQGAGGRAAPAKRTFAGGLTESKGSRSFQLATAAGFLRATLTLRKPAQSPVRLRLIAPSGAVVASVRGRLVLRLQARVQRASYRLVVSSAAKRPLSFKLTVTYPRVP
jgi:subtilisin family serine protease